MKFPVVVISFLVASGCGQDVFRTFSTHADAARAGAFDRGWLPNNLPESANSIEVRGNAELDLFAGEFSLSQEDFKELNSRLELYPEDPIGTFSGRDHHLAEYIRAKNAEGLSAGVVYEEPFMWVLTCHHVDLRCKYQRRTESNKPLQPIARENPRSGR